VPLQEGPGRVTSPAPTTMASDGVAAFEKGGTSASLTDSLVAKVQALDLPEPARSRVARPALMAHEEQAEMGHEEQADMGHPSLKHIFKGVTEPVLVAPPPPLQQQKMCHRSALVSPVGFSGANPQECAAGGDALYHPSFPVRDQPSYSIAQSGETVRADR
jgi:hypothetical protein